MRRMRTFRMHPLIFLLQLTAFKREWRIEMDTLSLRSFLMQLLIQPYRLNLPKLSKTAAIGP